MRLYCLSDRLKTVEYSVALGQDFVHNSIDAVPEKYVRETLIKKTHTFSTFYNCKDFLINKVIQMFNNNST